MLKSWTVRLVVVLLISTGLLADPQGAVFACNCGGATPQQFLVTQTNEGARDDLQIRDADTLEVLAVISGWEGDGGTVVGDSVWAIEPVDVEPAAAAALGGVLVSPRTPRPITQAETESRALIAASSDDEPGSSTTLVVLAITVLGVGIGAGALGWKRRSGTGERLHPQGQAGT